MKRLRKQNTVRVFLPTLWSIPGKGPSKRASNCRGNFLPGFRSPAVVCFPLFFFLAFFNNGRVFFLGMPIFFPLSPYFFFWVGGGVFFGVTSSPSRVQR